jgi:hypothetical protein
MILYYRFVLLYKISQHMHYDMLNIAKSPYAVTKLKPFLCPYWHSNCIMRSEGQSIYLVDCRSQWPRGLRRRSAAARLLRLCFRIPPVAWVSVCCECCVLSGKGLCDELITCPEESYRLWCVVVCDLEPLWMRRPWPTWGCRAKNKTRDME